MADEIAQLNVQQRVRDIINHFGAHDAGKELGVGRESALRIAGGFAVRTATLQMAQRRLFEVERKMSTERIVKE
jgi:hypothetical protein